MRAGADDDHSTADTGDSRTPSFGVLLRQMRVAAGLSQQALAERAGLSRKALTALEGGRRSRPRPATVALLAHALEVGPRERAALVAASAGATPNSARRPIGRRSNLPVPPTPFLGRDVEVAAATRILDPTHSEVRLLTLLGLGGVGKTRLALAVAEAVGEAYADGVVFIDLVPLRDDRLVAATIARALNLGESAGLSAREQLREHLRERQALLVLDNFEHLLAARPLLAELLESCPRLVLLITSRTALHLRAERRFLVGPLPTPDEQPLSLEAITASAAVCLFVERARAVTPDFALEASNAQDVAAICRRLEGMPLAIELAAARAGVLQPEMLLRRLDRRLPLLKGGAADLPERQQTLRRTLAWSYDLLGPIDQALFRRLAVFAGGFSVEAAEAVCAFRPESADSRDSNPAASDMADADDVLESLRALIDNSLLRSVGAEAGERHFAMHETVREYAEETLAHSGETERTRTRHLAWCLKLVEQAARELTGPHQAIWLERLDGALDNLRAALSWAQEQGQIESGLRLDGALGRFWSTRRYVGEGREWLEHFLAPEGVVGVPAGVRAEACYVAGLLANNLGDQIQAVLRLEQSIPLYEAADDMVGAVRALNTRGGVAYDEGQLEDAMALWEQSLAQARAVANLGEVAHALGNLGEARVHMGDLLGAEACHVEALALARQSGRTDLEAMQLGNLGNVARQRGDLAGVTVLQRQALVLKRELGARRQIASPSRIWPASPGRKAEGHAQLACWAQPRRYARRSARPSRCRSAGAPSRR